MSGQSEAISILVETVNHSCAHKLTERSDLSDEERQRIQKKQGGHHMPPRPEDGPPLDDTDRNSDKIIKPSQQPSRDN